MSLLRRLATKIAGLMRRGRVERELDEELQFHLDQLIAEGVAAGLEPAEARRRAMLRLGGVEQIKESHREARGLPLLESLFADVRYALRRLAREPGFTAVAVLTIAAGIGANSAIFSLVRGVLLEPLPYPEPERLVRVFETGPSYPRFPVSPLNFVDYRRESRTTEGLAAYAEGNLELSGDEARPERLTALSVSRDYFSVLGVRPLLGRLFTDEEAEQAARVVLLSELLWHRRFAGDPEIVGRQVTLQGESWTVVGILPAGFEHVGGDYRSPGQGRTVDAWWPLDLDPDQLYRGSHWVNVVGRMVPGATPAAVQSDLSAVAERLEEQYPETNTGWRVLATPLHREVVGRGSTLLWVLTASVGFVLLIACANVANLLLVRASTRQREIAMRAALGAGRGRLVRQSLTESAVLVTLGGLLGVALAAGGVRGLLALMPADFPRLHAIELNGAVLAFTAVTTLLTTFVCGVAPALRSRKAQPQAALSSGGSRGGEGRRGVRLRNLLVIAEVSLASALLIAAGLLIKSFITLQSDDPGFRSEGVLTFSLAFPAARYDEPVDRSRLLERLVERIESSSGVVSAGVSMYLPWSGWDENTRFGIVDDPVERERSPHARYGAASPGWFRTLGVPLVAGRTAEARDRRGQPPVVVVNQAFAETYLPGGAVGRRLEVWGEEVEVVGVVGDIKDTPADAAAEPAFYWSYAQRSWDTVAVAVRTEGDPSRWFDSVRGVVAELDPELPVTELRRLEFVASAAVAERRFLLGLVVLFAATALALAAAGAYGVLAYSVQQRRRELGVRVALGADGRRIVGLVLGQGLRLAVIGLVLGVGMALLLGRLLETVLYQVSPTDPQTLAVAVLTALAMAVVASCVPAVRAARSDPLRALRSE